jgi:hypothetical protein
LITFSKTDLSTETIFLYYYYYIDIQTYKTKTGICADRFSLKKNLNKKQSL